jgi:four helix bundle protein
MQTFRDLKVWQKAMELVFCVYKLTASFPREETYGLSSQLRRATVSIASNIAEGHSRQSRNEFRQFLSQAKGSSAEVQTQLLIARELSYGIKQQLSICDTLAFELTNMLDAFIAKLKKPS